MLKHGVFHVDPAFRVDGRGVIDTETTAYYFGASLGVFLLTVVGALFVLGTTLLGLDRLTGQGRA